MLSRVLYEMSTGKVHHCADMARRLAISEGLLALIMEDLAHKGYLAPLSMAGNDDCNEVGCARCRICPTCPPGEKTASRSWVLTAKGREAAKRHRQ